MPETLTPFIPQDITVHLGRPDATAENITVPFPDYIKNVASSEIYPTWPEAALRANIYAIISFALNRYYTEYYRSRGYNFDITNTTAFDQAFVKDRDIYENISLIVDEIFNDYVVRQGEVQPLFTQFCNGTTSQCAGLSQWGTVTLAEQGLTPYQILQNYYGNNIGIVEDAPVAEIPESYPGSPLIIGTAGNDVRIIQQQLSRIRRNYPAIPEIQTELGIFDTQTEEAVRVFQGIFNLNQSGEVDKSTWYKIKEIYNGVKRLSELTGEGLSLEEVTTLYESELAPGSSGYPVTTIQYYLNVIAYFNPNLNIIPLTAVFDEATANAVSRFQNEYGLTVTGTVNRETWNKITLVYNEIITSQPEGYQGNSAKLYPGYFLTPGAVGDNVTDLQNYLSLISVTLGNIPNVTVNGSYDAETEAAVRAFQENYGLVPTGSVGPLTWQRIAQIYDSIIYGEI